jgi:glycosyltransferase involved in cell wall biosynthesis
MAHDRTIILIPSYNAGDRLLTVIDELGTLLHARRVSVPLLVVDDGSSDDSMRGLAERGVTVLRHDENRGKGAALQTGLRWALDQGFTQAVTMDADGQHPADEALALVFHEARGDSLVLAVRDLARAGAPTANQRSNRFSNNVL